MSDNPLLNFPTFTLFLFLKKKKNRKEGGKRRNKERKRQIEQFRFFSVKDCYVDNNLMFPLEITSFRKDTQSFT